MADINPLSIPITDINGIGDKTKEALYKVNIKSIFDIILRAPKTILAMEKSPGISFMQSGHTYMITAHIAGQKLTGVGNKKRLEILLKDNTHKILSAVYFGPAVNYALHAIKNKDELTLTGEVKEFLGRMQMVHPKFSSTEATKESTITTYSQIGGLKPTTFKKIVDKAILLIKKYDLKDCIDLEFFTEHHMSSLKEAILAVHEPKSVEESRIEDRGKSAHFRRLAFEELLGFYLNLNLQRQAKVEKNSIPIPVSNSTKLSENIFPFNLTNAQERVINEITHDLSQPTAMARMIQGDVGSGKTAVSATIALHVANSGQQIAVMAPTEILAEQLYKVFNDFLGQHTKGIRLITASTKTKERKIITEQLCSGELSVVVGTHALLSDDVKFHKLGLIIIDEQHRFGVKQRELLLEEAKNNQGYYPHMLVMSATPIPRSLALTAYGDLELSVIDERPKGRIPIHTQLITGSVLKNIEKLCERILSTKQKAFIVFPLIEESENLDLENAKNALLSLQKKFGNHCAMILHGKMKSQEKQQVMNDFRDNKFSLLVSTTVVEVGVDIPDATCMIIAHPERFGLAQLHQLRGRVGRKDLKSYCFLVSDINNKFSTSYQRLTAMCDSDNGFKLAEIDLKIRGPGELLGTKQSGLPNFLVFNYTDFASLVPIAKNLAKTFNSRQNIWQHIEHLTVEDSSHFS